MKQILQQRAKIYGDAVDRNQFKSVSDLGGKAKSLKEKIQTRQQLAWTPPFVAQLGAKEFRNRIIMERMQHYINSGYVPSQQYASLSRSSVKTHHSQCSKDFMGAGTSTSRRGYCSIRRIWIFSKIRSQKQVYDSLNPIFNGVLAGINRRRRH